MDQFVAKQIYDALDQMDTKSCRFAHERADDPNSAQCNDRIQELRLGCAHGTQERLRRAVNFLYKQNFFSPEDAQHWNERILQAHHARLSVDTTAADEYHPEGPVATASLSATTLADDDRTLSELNAIRTELMQRLLPPV